jgi:hypothetical protein
VIPPTWANGVYACSVTTREEDPPTLGVGSGDGLGIRVVVGATVVVSGGAGRVVDVVEVVI